MIGSFANELMGTLFDLIEDCEDRRVRSWLLAAAALLFGGNMAFIWMLSAASNGRILEAIAALAASGALLFITGLCILRALWIAMSAEQNDLPAHWKWWALLGLIVIVSIPAPLVLLAALLGALYYWRHPETKSAKLKQGQPLSGSSSAVDSGGTSSS